MVGGGGVGRGSGGLCVDFEGEGGGEEAGGKRKKGNGSAKRAKGKDRRISHLFGRDNGQRRLGCDGNVVRMKFGFFGELLSSPQGPPNGLMVCFSFSMWFAPEVRNQLTFIATTGLGCGEVLREREGEKKKKR